MDDERQIDDEDEMMLDKGAGVLGAARASATFECVYTLCEARGLSSKMLRWHYRSEHPSLIEVSNAEFYRSNLIVPPAVITEREQEEGFIWERVNGAYDRGGKESTALRPMPSCELWSAMPQTLRTSVLASLLSP